MKKIKAVVRDSLPEVGDEHLGYIVTTVEPVELDFNNRGDAFVKHDFYSVTSVDAEYKGTEDESECNSFDYVAIRKAEVN